MSKSVRKAGRKILSIFLSATMGLSMVGGSLLMPVAAYAQTTAELQAQIQQLLQLVADLTAQLNGQTGGAGSGSVSVACNFTRSLKQGSTGEDVKCLQRYLNSAGFQVAATGAGSPGKETTSFGALTKAAVVKWQNAHKAQVLTPLGLSAGTGFFGSASIAHYKNLVAGAGPGPGPGPGPGTGTTTPSTGSVSVSAGAHPAATIVPKNAARVPFTKVNVMNTSGSEVTVNSFLVERTGASQNSTFSGVVLLDENGAQIGDSKTLSSLNQATVGSPVKIGAGQTRSFTIAGNIADSSSITGNIAYLSVNAVNLDGGATVSGSFPITGAGHQFTSNLTIGTITNARGPLDPNGNVSKPVGTTGYTFSSIRVTAGSAEKVRLNSIRWNQSGSVGASDLANVVVVVDGTSYPTTVSSDGKYYTATFSGGISIDKGLSKEISIKGDIVGGSGRNVAFDLYKTTDLNVSGETYGFGITPPTSGTGFASTNPWYDASVVTVTAGTTNSISKSNATPWNNAQNIAVVAANQPLGGFEVEIKGEPITIGQMIFNIQAQGDEAENITNITLVDANGAVLAGPADGASGTTNSAHGTVTFTDTVTFPVGKTVLTLRGQLGSTFLSNDTVQASTTPSSQWTTVRGANTGDTVSLSTFSSAITANLMTVKAGALAITVSTQPSARSVIAGAQGFEFARYVFDAGQSGEDVKISSIPLLLDVTTVTTADLSGCNLFDGETNVTDDTSVTLNDSPTDTTFTFDGGGVTVAKGTQKTLSMKCNVSAGATSGNFKWGIADNSSSYTGATAVGSGQTVAETITASAGQQMTAGSGGSYTVAEDTSLLYAAAQAGASNVTLGRFRFTAGGAEGVDIKQIALQLSNTASNSPADLVDLRVSIHKSDGTQIATAQFGGANADNATSTTIADGAARIAAGESILLTVKGNLSAQNVNEGTPGAALFVSYDGNNVGTNGNYGRGVDSQSNIDSSTTSDVTPDGIRIFRTVPTIAVTSTGGTLAPGVDLYKFTVTNPNSRDVVFQKFTFSIATSGGNVNGFTLFGDGVAFNTETTVNAVQGAPLEITATGSSDAQIIPANSSKTFALRASTVVDTASVSESISLALLADTSYPSLANLMGTVTTVEANAANQDNVIWSPFSTTTPEATSASQSNLDWTNGYGLPGLPPNSATTTVYTWTRAN